MNSERPPTRVLGSRGEQIAENRLRHEGYRILERNYRNVFGELDMIALDGDVLVFIEVKMRRSCRYGTPEMAVDAKKQKRLSRVALYYLSKRQWTRRLCRFDVVAIQGDQVNLFRNAFEAEGWSG